MTLRDTDHEATITEIEGRRRIAEGKAFAVYPEFCPICNRYDCPHDDGERMAEYHRLEAL